MATKVKLSEDMNEHSLSRDRECAYDDRRNINSAKGATFNVLHSSEITKVLRELTQCVASEHDLLVPCKQEKVSDGHCNETVHRSDISCSDISGSTTTNCSQDLMQERFVCQVHVCGDCGKNFSKKDFLQKHRIVHEEPRHRCVVCEKSFVREDKLKRHFVSIHSKHRPHVCAICAKAFARKDKLKDHQKHHITASNNFLCLECRIPFVQKSDLNRHTRGTHKTEEVGQGGSRETTGLTTTSEYYGSSLTMTAAFLPVLAVGAHTGTTTIGTGDIVHAAKPRKPRPRKVAKVHRVPESSAVKCEPTVTDLVPPTVTTSSMLYPHLPIMSLFPGHVHPCSTSTSSSFLGHPTTSMTALPPPLPTSSSLQYSSNTYNYPALEPMISTVFTLAPPDPHHHNHHSNHHSHSDPSSIIKSPSHHNHHPTAAAIFLSHNHNNTQPTPVGPPPPLTYYPYNIQQRPHLLAHSIPRPSLTTNIYPYLRF